MSTRLIKPPRRGVNVRRDTTDRAMRVGISLWLTALVGVIAFWGLVIYIALHFLAKVW